MAATTMSASFTKDSKFSDFEWQRVTVQSYFVNKRAIGIPTFKVMLNKMLITNITSTNNYSSLSRNVRANGMNHC